MTIGFRVLKRTRTVSQDVVERFAKLPVANVSDSMHRMTAGGSRLRPMHRSGGMAGVGPHGEVAARRQPDAAQGASTWPCRATSSSATQGAT